jgi:hypothetical protein
LLLAAPEDAAAMIYALGDTRDERRHPLKICRGPVVHLTKSMRSSR